MHTHTLACTCTHTHTHSGYTYTAASRWHECITDWSLHLRTPLLQPLLWA